MLEKIQKPNDIKKIPADQLPALAEEIREFIIESLSKTGGHLASNLGVVELTIAMHRVFDLPKDKLIWDVGHQSYTHKILSGRMAEFDELLEKVEELPTLYSVDLLNMDTCRNDLLMEDIKQYGREI